jgi:hypothetical protein
MNPLGRMMHIEVKQASLLPGFEKRKSSADSYILFLFIHSSVAPQPLPGLGLLFGFVIFYTHTVGLLG